MRVVQREREREESGTKGERERRDVLGEREIYRGEWYRERVKSGTERERRVVQRERGEWYI